MPINSCNTNGLVSLSIMIISPTTALALASTPKLDYWGKGIAKVRANSIFLYSVQFSRSVVSDSLQPCGLQHARPPCPSPTPGVYSNSCLLSQFCHPTISSSVVRFSSCLQSFPASGSFQMRQLVASGGHQVVLEFQLQHHSFQRNPRVGLLQNGLVGYPCSPRDSQESSPTPQFKSINSSALSFVYSPALIYIQWNIISP